MLYLCVSGELTWTSRARPQEQRARGEAAAGGGPKLVETDPETSEVVRVVRLDARAVTPTGLGSRGAW